MRRVALPALVLASSLLFFTHAEAGKPGGGGGKPSGGGSASAVFQQVGGSGIGGTVSLRELSSGTRITVSLKGLQYDVEYVSSWSTTVACDMGTAPPEGAFMRFRGSKRGTASFTVDVTEPFADIHSVAIQLGQYLALVACAPVN
jgi:hypothetical protein